jgi:ubiquinone/menaquinone biosynthesis C-methylase UbiE
MMRKNGNFFMETNPEKIQAEYYKATASSYDYMHTSDETDEHYSSLYLMHALTDALGLTTFLDVGAGTGRGVRYFLDRGKMVFGVEPVKELIEQAELRGIPRGLIVQGNGSSLPYEDRSIDAVFACGVLHHVAEPSCVVHEMARVAKKAVFLSDSNRFGQGPLLARLLKLALYKTYLWHTVRFIQTRGKMYTFSEGDGIAFSYSVFDSYKQLAAWADRIWLLPTATDRYAVKSWLHPLLTSPHLLLRAMKHPEYQNACSR